MGSSGPAKVDALVVNQPRSAAASLALTLLALAVGPRAACGEDPQTSTSSSCYAVLPTGKEILLNCNGQQHSIPTGADVWDFAVDQDGSTLALKRPVFHRGGWVTFDLGVLDLNGQTSVRVSAGKEDPWRLVPSCGTILVFTGSRARDVIHGSKLTMKPYSKFRCSSDRSVVAGVKKLRGVEIEVLLPLQRMVIPRDPNTEFELSPNGRYLAYMQRYDLMCVTEIGTAPACTPVEMGLRGPFSVSDEGEILFGSETQAGGLAYWKPGQPSPMSLQEVGTHPQWVTARAASALLDWSSAHGSPRWPAP
jgi:hypothetical protein